MYKLNEGVFMENLDKVEVMLVKTLVLSEIDRLERIKKRFLTGNVEHNINKETFWNMTYPQVVDQLSRYKTILDKISK